MSEIKAKDKVNDDIKDTKIYINAFKRKLDLILKLIRVLINLSIYEGNLTNFEDKNNFINKYFKLFDEQQNNLSLEFFKRFCKEFITNITKNILILNEKITNNLKNALSKCNKFINNNISIDELLNEVIIYFKETITYISEIKGNTLSIKIIFEFYDYLDDISKNVMDYKHITFPNKNKEEEKLKKQEKLDNDYIY